LVLSKAFIHFPLPGVPIELATDASDTAIGAIFFQRQEGKVRYLGFNSRKLKETERRYSVPKKELISILYHVKHYRDYLIGRPFKLYTDSQALATILNDLNNPKRNSILAGWMADLAEYSFCTDHIPGKLNVLPDLASRVQRVKLEPNKEEDEVNRIIEDTHRLGHWGAIAMYRHIRFTMGLNIPHLLDKCVEYTKQCPACLLVNKYKIVYSSPRRPELWKPMQYIHLDLMEMTPSSKGYRFVFVGIDQMSGFVYLKPLLTKSMHEVSDALYQWFSLFGYPGLVKSDQGREYCNSMVAHLVDAEGAVHKQIVKDDHHANGLVERAIRSVRDTLEKFKRDTHFPHGQDQWEALIPLVQFAINTRVRGDTHHTPFALMFGRHAFQYVEKSTRSLEEAQAAQLRFWETFHKEVPEAILQLRLQRYAKSKYAHHTGQYSIGDYVMVLNTKGKSKSDDKYDKCYYITELVDNGLYRVQNKTETVDVPANFLKPASKEAYEQLNNFEQVLASSKSHQFEDDHRDSTYGAQTVSSIAPPIEPVLHTNSSIIEKVATATTPSYVEIPPLAEPEELTRKQESPTVTNLGKAGNSASKDLNYDPTADFNIVKLTSRRQRQIKRTYGRKN